MTQRYPLTAAARASPIPVFPDVGSMIVSPCNDQGLFNFVSRTIRQNHCYASLGLVAINCCPNYRLELASLLGVLNHPQSNSVFHRPSRIEELAFCHWKRVGFQNAEYPSSSVQMTSVHLHISHLRPADWAILLILTSGVLPMACNTFGMMPGLSLGICSVWGPCIVVLVNIMKDKGQI